MINPPFSPIREKLLKKYKIIDDKKTLEYPHHIKENFSLFDEKYQDLIFVKKIKEMETEVENIREILENMKNEHNISILESLSLWIRELDSPPNCIHCLKNKTHFISFRRGWTDFCEKKCSSNYRKIKFLREIPNEVKLEANRIMEEYNFKCIEEAIYFIQNGYELKNKCKICGRPTEFKGYMQGYKILCSQCISKKFKNNKISSLKNKTKEEKERRIKNLSEIFTKVYHYGDVCYDILVKQGLRTLAQAVWHLDRKDPECILGRCINCGKRFGFISYNVGYGLIGQEKLCLSCRLKNKKTFFINRIPLKERTIHEYYEHAFLRRLNLRTTKKLHDLRGEKKILKSELKSEIEKDSEKKKLIKEKSRLQFINNWGSSYKNNPLLVVKGYKLLEENLKKFKNYLEKNGFDLNVLDLIDNPYWIKKIFVDEGMTIQEISYLTGLSESVIKRRLKRLGYLKREREYEEDENNNNLIVKKEPEILFYQDLNYDDDLEFELFKPFF